MFAAISDTKRARDAELGASDFVRCAALIATTGNVSEALRKAEYTAAPKRVVECLKSAQAGALTSNVGATNFGNMIGSFMQAVGNVGCFDRIAQDAMQLPLTVNRVNIYTSIASSSVGEGSAKPLRRLLLNATDISLSKTACQIVLTRELVDGLGTAGLQMLATELKTSVAAASDQEFLTALSGNSYEADGTPGWAGFLADLDQALRLLSVGASSRIYAILTPENAKTVATLALTSGLNIPWDAGSLAGVELLVSDAQSQDRLTVLDATGLAIALGPIGLRSTENASIEMDTAPTETSGPSVQATTQVSMFATNSVCLRVERDFAIKAIRNASYVHLTNIGIGATGDSPAVG